jgi:hypothetical protein
MLDQSVTVVPTALWTKASGKRAARRCTAFQPVQWAGISSRLEIVEGGDRGIDDRLEHWAAEVEAADHRGDSRLACERSCVCDDVGDAGMTAAGEDDEAATGQAHDERLVVEDQRPGGCARRVAPERAEGRSRCPSGS